MRARDVKLPSGNRMPVLGLGTWRMGESSHARKDEVAALRCGLDLGLRLIDTAEMYGEGGAEEVVGEAIKGRREDVMLVSKVYPHNAGRKNAIAACERSLKRLGTDYLDVYLLHWRGGVPLSETFEAFHALRESGKVRDFGVSNFDRDDMREAQRHDQGMTAIDQVYYNLAKRGVEWDLLPWCNDNGVAVMAYSPFDQGRLLRRPALRTLADRRQATPAQIALAWLLSQEGVVAIPKSSSTARVREICGALDVVLSDEELGALEVAFPPPSSPTPLDMT